MPEEAAFLQQLSDRPEDDHTRLVYADWLEERGDARARLLRLEVELAALADGDRGYAEREAELEALRSGLDADWCARAGKRWDVVHFGYALEKRISFIK